MGTEFFCSALCFGGRLVEGSQKVIKGFGILGPKDALERRTEIALSVGGEGRSSRSAPLPVPPRGQFSYVSHDPPPTARHRCCC
jgi:hypothetical protein